MEEVSDVSSLRKSLFTDPMYSNGQKSMNSSKFVSQEEVNKLTDQCEKGGFFVGLSSYFDLSKKLKENIANYCLILSLYFQNGNNEKALNFFLLMSKYNKRAITFLTSKIITQLTQLKKITDKSKIAAYYSVMTRMMMQVISVLIKISGKLDKSIYENYYITLYFKILYALSKTTIKGGSNELRIHLKNERKYFYLSCLFDLSIYLFYRYKKPSTCTSILQHILDHYGKDIIFEPNEIESVFLLKVKYNLGLFYYVDGQYKESILHLNQARERLLEIKSFPLYKKFQKNKETKDDVVNHRSSSWRTI